MEAHILNYSRASGRSHRPVHYISMVVGCVLSYGGVFLLGAWVSAALERFQAAEGRHALYGTARWPYYAHWGGDVQFSVGIAWVVLITVLGILMTLRQRASLWLCAANALLNLLAIPMMAILFESIAFWGGLYP